MAPRIATRVAALAALVCGVLGVGTASGQNSIQIENAKPGTTEWRLTSRGLTSRAIEGYASLTSVAHGERLDLFVNTAAPSYTIDIFRLGYYGGRGGRRMMPTVTRAGRVQPACPLDSTNMIECAWQDAYTLTIPISADATDWLSGIYLVKLTESAGGRQQYVTFTVRDDTRSSDLIFVQTVNTYQAYNVWGGKSLYGTIEDRDDHAHASHRVSFNRPYYGDSSDGAGQLIGHESEMLTWLEREGYDVSYATNVDLDRDENLLLNHRAYLSVGHDEYWTKGMYDHVEQARDAGVSLGFFSGNNIYWQVRYEPGNVGGQPRRSMVGYKSDWRLDPMLAVDPTLVTNLWRAPGIGRSEDRLQGVLFVTQARPVMVIEDASHWAFTGTGLRNGDRLTEADGTPFLGYEVDQMGAASPANVQRLAHSPATPRAANFSDVTIYRTPSGATVFATGSIGWSATVPQIQQITRNVLARFISGAFTDAPPVRPALPAPFAATDIGDVARSGFVALAGSDWFTLNGAGRAGSSGNDALYYVHQPLDGNGEIVVRLNTLQKQDSSRAGLMIRESLAPNARYIAVMARPSETATGEGIEFHVKDVVGVRRRTIASLNRSLPSWMRLIRTGDTFDAFGSVDGVAWVPIGSFVLPLPRRGFIGVAVSSAITGVWATAAFDNVRVTFDAEGGDTLVPTIAITAPAPGSTVSAIVGIAATASDNVGIAGVQFKVDGVNLGSEDVTAPYAASWDSTAVANGSHTLTAEARDAAGNRATASITVTVSNPVAVLPAGWAVGDVGAAAPAATASYESGTFNLAAAGSRLYSTSDAFGTVYRSWTGDGDVVARVQSLTLPSGASEAQAGIMFRESLAPGARHASLVIGADGKLKFRRRTSTGGTTLSEGPTTGTTSMPRWLKLSRRGNLFSASHSRDGVVWTAIPVSVPTVSLPSTALVGILALRNGGTENTQATFTNVSVTGEPVAWTGADVGAVGTPGSFTQSGGSFTLRGGGTDIWDRSDAFHFVYLRWAGDGTFVARLASLTNAAGASFSLGALMFRDSLAPESTHAAMMVTTDGKAKFRRRTSPGGTTLSNGPTTGTTSIPRWIRLVRSGSNFSAYLSANGTTWTQVAPTTSIPMSATAFVGMLVLRNGGSDLATATFTDVTLTR